MHAKHILFYFPSYFCLAFLITLLSVLSNKISAESGDSELSSYTKTTATFALFYDISVDPPYLVKYVLLGKEGMLTQDIWKCPFPNALSSNVLVQLPP